MSLSNIFLESSNISIIGGRLIGATKDQLYIYDRLRDIDKKEKIEKFKAQYITIIEKYNADDYEFDITVYNKYNKMTRSLHHIVDNIFDNFETISPLLFQYQKDEARYLEDKLKLYKQIKDVEEKTINSNTDNESSHIFRDLCYSVFHFVYNKNRFYNIYILQQEDRYFEIFCHLEICCKAAIEAISSYYELDSELFEDNDHYRVKSDDLVNKGEYSAKTENEEDHKRYIIFESLTKDILLENFLEDTSDKISEDITEKVLLDIREFLISKCKYLTIDQIDDYLNWSVLFMDINNFNYDYLIVSGLLKYIKFVVDKPNTKKKLIYSLSDVYDNNKFKNTIDYLLEINL